MSQRTAAPRSRIALLAAVALLGSVPAGCSKPQVGGSDGVSGERIEVLEREIRDLKDRLEASGRGSEVPGLEAQSVADRTLDLERKVAELERRLLAAASPASPGAGAPTSEGGTSTASPPGPVLAPIAAGDPIPEEQISTFRRLLDESNRRAQEERRVERFRRDLERAQVKLSAEQETAVIKMEEAYASKIRDLYRSGVGENERDRQALRDQRNALVAQFEKDLQSVVPAADADKIVQTLRQRNPGFYSPRDGAVRSSAPRFGGEGR